MAVYKDTLFNVKSLWINVVKWRPESRSSLLGGRNGVALLETPPLLPSQLEIPLPASEPAPRLQHTRKGQPAAYTISVQLYKMFERITSRIPHFFLGA